MTCLEFVISILSFRHFTDTYVPRMTSAAALQHLEGAWDGPCGDREDFVEKKDQPLYCQTCLWHKVKASQMCALFYFRFVVFGFVLCSCAPCTNAAKMKVQVFFALFSSSPNL